MSNEIKEMIENEESLHNHRECPKCENIIKNEYDWCDDCQTCLDCCNEPDVV